MTMPDPIFDESLARVRLARALRREPADFLLARTATDVVERLGAVQRRFTMIADVGTPTDRLAVALADAYPEARVVHLGPMPVRASVVCDLERLPLAAGRFDLATSTLALQTTNDLPGALIQIRQALKPDGLFLGALLGGRTLGELRGVLAEAEADLSGGASPRVAPFADVRDMGGLMQRAGFALPVADSEVLTVRYANLFALLADLRAMGATNTLVARSRRPTPRALFGRAAQLYAERFAGPDGRIAATFEIVSVSGWAQHASQAAPAKRGSGRISLADALRDKSLHGEEDGAGKN